MNSKNSRWSFIYVHEYMCKYIRFSKTPWLEIFAVECQTHIWGATDTRTCGSPRVQRVLVQQPRLKASSPWAKDHFNIDVISVIKYWFSDLPLIKIAAEYL